MTRKLPTLCIATTTEELIEFMKELPDDPKELKPCPSEKELEQIAKEVFGFSFIDNIQPVGKMFYGDDSFTDRIKRVLQWNTRTTPQPQPPKSYLFWRHVNFNGPTIRESIGNCWEWTGYIDPDGRGKVTVNKETTIAARVAWELDNGPIPEGLFACHRCDNGKCVRPSHLFLGTHEDNMRDCSAKNRHKNSKKTHCTHGHEFTPENTTIAKNGSRHCRACAKRIQEELRLRRRINERQAQ